VQQLIGDIFNSVRGQKAAEAEAQVSDALDAAADQLEVSPIKSNTSKIA
jgi:hypothetical protein